MIKQLILPPVFSDPAENRRAKLLHGILLVLATMNLIGLVLFLLQGYHITSSLVLPLIAFTAIELALLVVLRRRHLNLASLLFVLMILIGDTFYILQNGGLSNPATATYVLMIFAARIFLRRRAFIAISILAHLALLFLYAIQRMGRLADFTAPETLFTPVDDGTLFVTTFIQLFILLTITFFTDYVVSTMNKALRRAEEANQAKSEFVSFVSHELKNPLTAIKLKSGYVARAKTEHALSAKQQAALQTIDLSVNRMQQIIEDLTDISQIETGQFHMELAPMQLQNVIDIAVASTQSLFQEKQQTLQLQLQPVPDFKADQHRLTQVLINLLSNAAKYTPEHGVITLQTTYAASIDEVTVSVIDSGVGIRKEEQDKIFQQFFRANDDGVNTAGGTGLGLHISRALVELHGGKINFKSTHGKGSTFYFTLPFNGTTSVNALLSTAPLNLIN